MKLSTTFKILMLAAIFISCKKERDENACALTTNNLSGTYLVTSLKYKPTSTSPEQDYLLLMPACSKDNLLQLKSDGTYRYIDQGIVCTPEDSGNGTWNVTGNQLESDGSLNGTIASYDCKVLVYYLEDTFTDGDRLTFTITKQ